MGIAAAAGRVRVDCHLHTVASGDAVLTLEQLAERARLAGLDVVCITDHNVTAAAVQATKRDLGVRVIVGEEIRTPDGDVIGLFLTERIPYVLPLAEVIGRIKAQQALVYVPHPFDLARSSLGRVLPGLCEEGAVDIIEVFNAKISDPALNYQAADLAARFALPGGAGSDAHDAPGVGAAYLEIPDFDGPAGFLAALADAQLTGEFRDHAVRYPRRSVLPRPQRLAGPASSYTVRAGSRARHWLSSSSRLRAAMFSGISLRASRRTMSGISSLPMPYPVKSTLMVSRDRESVTGSTWTSTTARIGPSVPRTPQVSGGLNRTSSEVDGRSAPPMRRVMTHFAPTPAGWAVLSGLTMCPSTTPFCHSLNRAGSVATAKTSAAGRSISAVVTTGGMSVRLFQ